MCVAIYKLCMVQGDLMDDLRHCIRFSKPGQSDTLMRTRILQRMNEYKVGTAVIVLPAHHIERDLIPCQHGPRTPVWPAFMFRQEVVAQQPASWAADMLKVMLRFVASAAHQFVGCSSF